MKDPDSSSLRTDRVILRRFDNNDLDALYLILSDEEANRFLPWYPVKTREETRDHLKARDSGLHAVCLKTDNIPIGYISTGGGESRDFGYGLRKEFWNRGIITEAAAAMAGYLKQTGWPYITATHDINNPASGAVMKKIGMTYRYSYVEQWQPKGIQVTFRLYQLNFDGNGKRVYLEYWNKYPGHFIEENP